MQLAALTEKQTKVLAFLQHYMQQKGRPPTQAEMGDALGFTRSMARLHLAALAEKGYISAEDSTARGLRILQSTIAALPPNSLPVIGRIAAGTPVMSDENVEEYLTVEPTLFRPRAQFLRRVEGWSMRNANIFDRDLVGIHQTHEASNRQIVAVRIPDPQTGDMTMTLKRYTRDGRYVVLLSENDDQERYAPIRIDTHNTEFAIEGLYAGLIRPAGGPTP
ncbi:transcriptional repressor LexA [Hydrocarboniphaga sp.]|uniref:transcriptional repressor LexA n=1 Tax=Hydrocarboniphaga sp. TaxID=2033016 RepID=UPI003D10C32E